MIAKKEKGEKILTLVIFKSHKDKILKIKRLTGQTISHIVREMIEVYK